MPDTAILTEEQLERALKDYNDGADLAACHIPVLCATVRALRTELDRGALCEQCDQWEYNEDGSCRTFTVCGACWNEVQSQLAAVTQKRDALLTKNQQIQKTLNGNIRVLQSSNKACDDLGELLTEARSYRTRAVQLCNDMAEEWERLATLPPDSFHRDYVMKATAAREILKLVEGMK